MEDYKLKKYKNILIQEKERIENVLENSIDDHSNEELSNVDNHPADIGTEMFMKEQDEGFKTSYKDTLEQIDRSISNIGDGNYGTCSSCNEQIDEERLEVIPYTSLCTNCMKEEEDNIKKYESLDEDYITEKSHSRDNVQFDREDSYEQVAEYEKNSKDPSDSTEDEDIENISQEYYDKTQE